MKFSLLCLRVVLTVFALFGVTGFYPSGHLTVKRFLPCRVYGFLILLACSAYYCYRFDKSKQFFLKSTGELSLIYFEFNLFWFVTVAVFAETILNGGKFAVWFKCVIDILRGYDQSELSSLFASVTVSFVLDLVFLVCYVTIANMSRNQPDLSARAVAVYTYLCAISAMIALQIMMAKLFLATLLKRLSLELNDLVKPIIRKRFTDDCLKNYVCVKKLQRIMSDHYNYSMLEYELNKFFSVQNLLFTVLCFVELTYSTYYLLSSARSGSLFIGTDMRFSFSVSYFGFYFLQFLQYTIPYEMVNDQKIKDTLILGLTGIGGEDDHLQNMMETFLIQCGNLDVNETAAGFFKIGHVLIGKVFGIIVSALVILLQFEQLSSSGHGFRKSENATSNYVD